MSKPSGNTPLNIRNLAYFQSLRTGTKLDPVRLAEAFDDISTAFAALANRTTTLENPTTPVTSAGVPPVFVPPPFISNIPPNPFKDNPSFSAITTGDNSQAQMTVDSGASLSYVNDGVVNANEIGTVVVDGNLPDHAGQILISQPGNEAAVWADPLVQGLYPPGTYLPTANGSSPPSPLNPVLVGAQNPSGLLENLRVDANGNLLVNTIESSTGNAPSSTTVGTSSAQALASNTLRKGLILINTSANTISIGFGTSAVLYYGITLYPGGCFNMGSEDFTTQSIQAIASAAGSLMSIQEMM